MRKLLALTLSLLMVFSVMPMTFAFAEGETYLTMFDASSQTAASQIGSIQSSDKNSTKIVTYAVPTGETDADGNPITEDRQVLKFQRTGDYNGCGVGIKADYRNVIKGAIGIRFWMAGDPATFDASDKVSVSVQTSSFGYKNAVEHQGVWKPTLEGATYEFFWNTSNNVWKSGASTMDVEHPSAGKANALFTEPFLGQVKQIMFGVDAYSAGSLKEMFYIDDVELIYPEGVTPAPVEFTATFVGTETAQLAEDVPSVKSDAANNDAVVMPEATLTEGTLAGWALNGDIKKVYAPGEVVNVSGNATFYAVNTNKPVLETPAAPIADTVNGSIVALKAVTGAVYSKDGATWQTSSTFEGLTPGATYTFYQKMSETLTHAESAVSEGLTVTTPVFFKWNLYSDNFTITENTTPAKFNTQYSGDGTYFFGTGLKAGQAVTFVSTANLQPGVYSANLWARTTGSRAPIDVEINGVKVKSALNTGTNKGYDASFALDEATVEIYEEGPVTLKLTATGTGGLYLNSLELIKVADVDLGTTRKVKIDGEVVAEVELGSEYTIPTPPTGYYYSDGTTDYYGGEVVVIEKSINLTSTVKTTSVVYTMDEGSRIVSGYTQTCTPGDGVFEEVSGDWVFKLPSKGDQQLNFTLPIDWFEKPYYKATSISFSISKTSGAAGNTDFVRFTDGKEYVSISEGYTSMLSKYTVDVDESLYGYRTFTMKLKGGSNFVAAKDYIYIDDVTVNFEYDFNYVAPTTYDVTIDGEVVATVEEGSTFTLPALEAGKYYVGYEGVTEIVVTEALNLTTATYTYEVKVDGEVKATVAYGETYTLPAAPEGKQYVDGYVAGQEFVVTGALAFFTEDIPFVAPEVAITMVKGAQLRFNQAIGMRYRATVDAAAVAAYEAEGYTVTMGTLISPADIIGSFDALTFEAGEDNYIDVVTTGYYATSENEIAGSIVNIKETNVGRNYIARSYVKLTAKDGSVYVSYATENDNTRSVKFLANAVIDNDALPANTAQVALIEKWAAAADWKK